MLFHLKEPDYQTEAPKDIPTRFYGRNPEQILKCLEYYAQRIINDGVKDNPNIVWWAKKKFSAEDLEQVDKGKFYFITGMISFAEEDKDKDLFDAEIKVTEDFSVYVPSENIGNFALWRTAMQQRERGGLYKLLSPIELFQNLSFVPEDIALAIRSQDLTPYLDVVKKDMARRAELSQHPNIKVDGLQRTIEKLNDPERN